MAISVDVMVARGSYNGNFFHENSVEEQNKVMNNVFFHTVTFRKNRTCIHKSIVMNKVMNKVFFLFKVNDLVKNNAIPVI